MSGNNGSEGTVYASKIRLVESVIMNNASCAPVTLRESASRGYRYCIGEGGGSDCSRGKGYSRFIACSKFSSLVAAYAHHARLYTVNKGYTAFLFIE